MKQYYKFTVKFLKNSKETTRVFDKVTSFGELQKLFWFKFDQTISPPSYKDFGNVKSSMQYVPLDKIIEMQCAIETVFETKKEREKFITEGLKV